MRPFESLVFSDSYPECRSPVFTILRWMVKRRRARGGVRMAVTGTESLFLVLRNSFFLKHPLTNVRWAIHHLNALCLALIQEANSIGVGNADFVQVQSRRLSALLDFGAQIDEVRTLKCTGQTNSSPVILTKPFNSQRHCWHPHSSVGDANRRPFKMHSELKS
jgi:hypothetical protein